MVTGVVITYQINRGMGMQDDTNNQSGQQSNDTPIVQPAHEVPALVKFPTSMAFTPTDNKPSQTPAIQSESPDYTGVGSQDLALQINENLGKLDLDSAPSTPAHNESVDSDSSDDLLSIKQQALSQLSPLIGQLDQTPEEKFRTTMMMIQATDDKSLVKVAFAAAQTIEDEKIKAQSLLDIINEINYFTQQHES